LLLIVLMTFVIIGSVRSGMESVSRISDELERRDIDDLNPIDLAGVPSELSPLLLQTNDMLQRLSEAVAAQRRFIGHASHQVRSELPPRLLDTSDLRQRLAEAVAEQRRITGHA